MSFYKSKVFIVSSALIIAAAIIIPTVILTTIERDTFPPTIEIINPTQDAILSGTISIECVASDTGPTTTSIDSIELWFNETIISTSLQYQLDTTIYPDGPYSIKAIAYDLAGLSAEVEVDIVIDNFLNPVSTDYFKLLNYNVKESGTEIEWKEIVKDENADIIIFVETGTWADNGNYKLERLLTQFNGYFYDEAPYDGYTAQGQNLFSTTGEAIFSRYPILEFNQLAILPLDDNTSYDVTHDFIHAVVNITGTEVNIIGFHLKCCEGEVEEWRREREQEGIINYMDELGDVPIIYAGDINSLSPVDVGDLAGQPGADFGYGPVTMLIDPEDLIYGNYSSKVHNFTDVFRALNPDDPGYTMNVPTILSRIDFIFVNQHFENAFISSSVGSNTEYDDIGSDHYSVEAIFQIANISASVLPQLNIQKEETRIFQPVSGLVIQKPSEIQVMSFIIHPLSSSRKWLKMVI